MARSPTDAALSHQAIGHSGWLLILFGILFILLMISLAGLVALFLSLGLARAIAFWPFAVILALLVLGAVWAGFVGLMGLRRIAFKTLGWGRSPNFDPLFSNPKEQLIALAENLWTWRILGAVLAGAIVVGVVNGILVLL